MNITKHSKFTQTNTSFKTDNNLKMILKSHKNEIKTKTNPESTKLILTTVMNFTLEKLIRESKQEH